MYSKNNNTKIIIGVDREEIIEELFDLFLHRYQVVLGMLCFLLLTDYSISIVW